MILSCIKFKNFQVLPGIYLEETGPGRNWTWKKLDLEETGPGRNWTWKKLDLEETGPGRNWTWKKLDLDLVKMLDLDLLMDPSGSIAA